MDQIRFQRIGSESSVFDAVTVTYREGAYSATARRDTVRATVRTSFSGDAENSTTASERATYAAWRARVAMAGKWHAESLAIGEHLREIADRTHAEWTDQSRYVVVVSVEVPSYGYVVTFIPRELVEQ